MFTRLVYLLVLTIYTALAGVLLTFFEAKVLIVASVLSLLPIVVLWRLENLRTGILPILAVLAVGVTVLFEAYAYINGLWYEISPSEVRLFGMIPVEAFLAAFVHMLYFVVVYEYFFDDRRSVRPALPMSLRIVLGSATAMLAFGISYIYLFSSVIVSNAFLYLLLGGCVVLALAVMAAHRNWITVLKKAALYALAILPVSLVYEYVSLQNDLRFFANFNEYLYTFSVFGFRIPIEEIAFIVLVPFWLIVIYELYLDDGK